MTEQEEKKIREKYRKLTELLIDRKQTISTMESATGGLLASLITDTEGASAILPGSAVTYCNAEKIKAGVPTYTINRYSVYSKQTAEAMARAAKEKYKTDYAVGVTGNMGNVDPKNPEGVPGEIMFAIATPEKLESFYIEIPRQERYQMKLAAAGAICDYILRVIC